MENNKENLENVETPKMMDTSSEKEETRKKNLSAQVSYSRSEELINIITHLVGAVLSVIGTALMVVKVCVKNMGALAIVAISLYGFCMIVLYLMSTLYHSQPVGYTRRAVFRRIDHCSVALLIAGTYAPIMLIGLPNAWGISIAAVVFGMAALVIIFNSIDVHKFRVFSMIAYVVMGWACIIQIVPLFKAIGGMCFAFIFAGGIVYTVGILFYKMKKIKYNHAIWHFFVLGGTILQFVAIYFFLL